MSTKEIELNPEIFIGLVGAVGTDLSEVYRVIQQALTGVGYETHEIRLASLLRSLTDWIDLPTEPSDEYLNSHMTAGDELRVKTNSPDAMALLGITALRGNMRDKPNDPQPGVAYVFRSLKLPEEIDTLRNIYGSNLLIVGAYSPRDARVINIAKRIARSHNNNATKYRSSAEKILDRDEHEDRRYGQNVRDSFRMADAFLDATNRRDLSKDAHRLINLVFGHPYITPSKDEMGMFMAQAARRRSSALGRQVGAAITDAGGSIISVGTNDVPRSGGGQYWEGDEDDAREFTKGHDTNDVSKRNVAAEFILKLREEGWLDPDKSESDVNELIAGQLSSLLRGTQILDLTEFGREIHAEMAAIMEAASRGVSILGCTLYTTTFPCHHCARHIVGAGLKRVVYLEPYAKSLASEYHSDAISVDEAVVSDDRVSFEPFVGVSHPIFMQAFEMSERKQADGQTIDVVLAELVPKLVERYPSYMAKEVNETGKFHEQLEKADLI